MFDKVLRFLVLSGVLISLDLRHLHPQYSLHLCLLQVENVNSMSEGSPSAALALGARYAGLAFILYVRYVDLIYLQEVS